MLLEGEAASAGWRDWLATHDPEGADAADRALFPSLYLDADRLAIELPARSTLRQAYMTTWARNHTALRLYWEVSRRLESADVRVVCLKGLPLLFSHYGDLGARPMADIDILVRTEDVHRAADVLRASGLTPMRTVAVGCRGVVAAIARGRTGSTVRGRSCGRRSGDRRASYRRLPSRSGRGFGSADRAGCRAASLHRPGEETGVDLTTEKEPRRLVASQRQLRALQ